MENSVLKLEKLQKFSIQPLKQLLTIWLWIWYFIEFLSEVLVLSAMDTAITKTHVI